jgi:hypothetical protein
MRWKIKLINFVIQPFVVISTEKLYIHIEQLTIDEANCLCGGYKAT